MNNASRFLLLFSFWTLSIVGNAAAQSSQRANSAKQFLFDETTYVHRYTSGDQHEFTPQGQEDLKTWTEMVTIHDYRHAKDGEGLAATASRVVDAYKANRAHIVRTASVPRTKERPAEHLIVAVLGKPDFLEAVFARFAMHNGTGIAIISSHRIYGQKVGSQMSAWLEKTGPAREQTLMQWDPRLIPNY